MCSYFRFTTGKNQYFIRYFEQILARSFILEWRGTNLFSFKALSVPSTQLLVPLPPLHLLVLSLWTSNLIHPFLSFTPILRTGNTCWTDDFRKNRCAKLIWKSKQRCTDEVNGGPGPSVSTYLLVTLIPFLHLAHRAPKGMRHSLCPSWNHLQLSCQQAFLAVFTACGFLSLKREVMACPDRSLKRRGQASREQCVAGKGIVA